MIDQLTKEQKEIIEQYQKEIPVDIGALAKKIGVSIYVANLTKASGQIIKDSEESSGYAIFVNSSDNKKKTTFYWRTRISTLFIT